MAKSPTRRKRQSNAAFEKDQEIWLVQRSAFYSPVQLRRAFIRKFLTYADHRKAPPVSAFRRLIIRFEESGGTTGRCKEQEVTAVTPENVARVEEFFTNNPKSHISDAVTELQLSHTSIWRCLRLQLKWKPYKPLRVNMLSEQNKRDRVEFCQWFLAQGEDFAERVLWSDEKWFVLHPAPNTQNDIIWAPWHPEEEVECRRQGDSKVMAWCGMVDGRMLQVRWMVDEAGRPASVNGDRYQALLQEVWPEVRFLSNLREYWAMQDGATSHTTAVNLAFLLDKFRGRVISRRSEHFWPPYSPDLNPLDFFVWGYLEAQVKRIKPTSVEELRAAVEDVARTVPEEMIRDAAKNVIKRCKACIAASGGHFEYFLKSM